MHYSPKMWQVTNTILTFLPLLTFLQLKRFQTSHITSPLGEEAYGGTAPSWRQTIAMHSESWDRNVAKFVISQQVDSC